jgi:ATP-binding protein involved in chromosome partitioning
LKSKKEIDIIVALKRGLMSRNLLQSGAVKDFSTVRHVIAVAAGKGGVGKSSVSMGVALALEEEGYTVGVLDADIYGPSMGIMMPLDKPVTKDENGFLPGESSGVKVFSLAYLRKDEAMIVRAPVANGLILQCARDVSWGELDYLIVDFPPGTGDIQLTLMQEMVFSGAVLVTTPGEVALADVKKAAEMFHHMGVPLVGVVENMAYFEEPVSSKRHYVFGKEGGKRLSSLLGAPFLGEIPIDKDLSTSADCGWNILEVYPNSSAALKIKEVTGRIKDTLFDLEREEGEYLKSFELVWEN